MIDLFSSDEPWVNWGISAGIFAVSLLLAFASRLILHSVMRLLKHTKTTLDDTLLEALAPIAFVILVVTGLWIALTRLPETVNYSDFIEKSFIVVYILTIAVAIVRVFHGFLKWYTSEMNTRMKTTFIDRFVPILRRVADIVIYSVALVIILSRLGQDIGPLLAGLGIGGLAVALALQSTLSNFLSGTYVITDSIIQKGHYILLDSGQEGYVEDIGWRTTKIRHWQGNLIILPNNKLADAIVTDFERPYAGMVFTIDCGVSYNSDLQKVERVSFEIAKKLLETHPAAAKDFEPVIRFNKFGDSNVNFAIVLKGVDRMSQFILKHEFIKALHKKFHEEGIEIQYPVRKLFFGSALTSGESEQHKRYGFPPARE